MGQNPKFVKGNIFAAPLKSRMTEPGGVQNPILLARRAAVIDKYEGVVIRSCPQIFVIFK